MSKEPWQMTFEEFAATIRTRPRAYGEPPGPDRPLDLTWERDQAYVRVLHKRAIRAAMTRLGVAASYIYGG